MAVQTRPLADVTRRAIEILSREMGATDTIRFVNQFITGLGDYIEDRDEMFEADTLESILDSLKTGAERPEAPKKRRRATRGRKRLKE